MTDKNLVYVEWGTVGSPEVVCIIISSHVLKIRQSKMETRDE